MAKDPMNSTRGVYFGVDSGVVCGVAIVGWSGVVRGGRGPGRSGVAIVENHSRVDKMTAICK